MSVTPASRTPALTLVSRSSILLESPLEFRIGAILGRVAPRVLGVGRAVGAARPTGFDAGTTRGADR